MSAPRWRTAHVMMYQAFKIMNKKLTRDIDKSERIMRSAICAFTLLLCHSLSGSQTSLDGVYPIVCSWCSNHGRLGFRGRSSLPLTSEIFLTCLWGLVAGLLRLDQRVCWCHPRCLLPAIWRRETQKGYCKRVERALIKWSCDESIFNNRHGLHTHLVCNFAQYSAHDFAWPCLW